MADHQGYRGDHTNRMHLESDLGVLGALQRGTSGSKRADKLHAAGALDPVVLVAFAILLASVGWLLLGPRKRPAVVPVPRDAAATAPPARPLAKRGRLVILWGSQTGTAEGFAKTLEHEALERGFEAQHVDLEDYDVESLAQEPGLVVFLMATHGEGEPTDNAVAFHAWLGSGDRPGDEMGAVRFAAFALGNRQYEKFCSEGIWVDERMAQLGAARVHALGQGDDDQDLEADFEHWRIGLWSELGCADPDAEAAGATGPAFVATFRGELPDSSSVDGKEDGWEADWLGAPLRGQPPLLPLHQWMSCIYPKLGATPVRVLVNRELQAYGSAESTRHLELALAPPSQRELEAADALGPALGARAAASFRGARTLRYTAADDAGLYAQNSRERVALAARLLGVSTRALFELGPSPSAPPSARAMPFPTPCSVGRVLRWYADLSAPPSKALLGRLARFCADESEAAALRVLGSEAGVTAYHRWALDGRRSVLDALAAAPSARLPLGAFVELCARLQPRYYTISSSPLAAPRAMHLTVKVVREAPAREPALPPLREGGGGGAGRFEGVCSAYLAATRAPGSGSGGGGAPNGFAHARGGADLVLAFVKPSAFRLPPAAETPMVMVGAGTGVAPFRALVQHLQQRREALPSEALLYFGCQHRARDFLYADEFAQAVGGAALERGADGRAGWEAVRPAGTACAAAPLSLLRVAFSREEASKVYVQHLVAADGALLWHLLARCGAHVHICGGTAMGRAVCEALVTVARQHGGMGADEASVWMHQLESSKHLVKELWAA
ncbi:hypothetical protein T492DRAFT_1152331 [Pavlovales sp. CCMP2436]|nr:hypothetical protein T492DRAFT_1152331 [Pavlovales sp. CCMP2436]